MKRYQLFCLATLCALCGQAHAATIQQNYGLFAVNFLTGNSAVGALPGFNPALGTSDGVAFTFDASAVLVQGTAQSSRIGIEDSTGTLLTTITFPEMVGRDQQIEMGSFSVPAVDLTDFESTGNVDLTLSPFTACRGSANTPTGCNEFTGALSGTVSYTYTPVPANTPTSAPEPDTLSLLAASLASIMVWSRRR